ncbi:type II toxin-antitoxin system RelB/DinJ family antitoxin [Lactobacillus amylovorus]|uniref:Type II toxin-antitoxin system RelB/DinJ family antitoxin n=2 Tax=Lactobacillus amylovorus TaxID=1604 RepID=A0A9X3W855_LACAM|nr:type II toxin-antitoxin system RelB/DinJ family antitoxin [Lactobacillus amylovorus]MDB6234634.1 type II toxin-antitoxin system RelB/DinJ family antitoxin [Lactobacillus amylovorus]MDB6243372.1 type II toxin-antitoxin system RelB/DinJ family antitoxin [Lactobacillus amylovorus]MDB6245115.1 type II toxin-antitoxin system RelB/DinJ family antitoxin [Lactobacillus amylovorus]MDB6248977.1 type II toxin-antitoxin system RelB/DinJ family antitoxin [Lactobacillus amylovorus]MDB6252591.1 type II to
MNKRVQANVNKKVASQAELVMDELGLNPTVVINALYKKIAATGEIPFSFKKVNLLKSDVSFHYVGRLSSQDKNGLRKFIDELG